MPRFLDERGCLKPVFVTLWHANERRQRMRMADLKLTMLPRLRQETVPGFLDTAMKILFNEIKANVRLSSGQYSIHV